MKFSKLISFVSFLILIFSELASAQSWTTYNMSNSGLPCDTVCSIAIDGAGNKWIGSWGGLAKYDGTGWMVYSTANSNLPANDILCVTIDGIGNKWIGTWGDGVAKFDGTNWTVYKTSNSNLPGNYVWSIAIDGEGNKWIGTSSGLAKIDGTNWTVYNTSNSGLTSNTIYSITIDGSGNKWIGSAYSLARFDGITWTVYNSTNSGLPDNCDILAVAVDITGNKWLGTSLGLIKFDGTNWTIYNTSNSSLPHNEIRTITIDDFGNKWIGTRGGLAKFDDVNWTIFNTSNSGLPQNEIKSIAIDNLGNKWIGTGSGGIVLFDDNILYGGKVYHSVKIGKQTWLKENLDIGTMILGSANSTDDGIIEKYCYDDNSANCETYGGLYRWDEAMVYNQTSGIKGICPSGWHLPTKIELETLSVFVGNNSNALKTVGQGTGTGVGTNTSGFSALLSGLRFYSSGLFEMIGLYTAFWSSTERDAEVSSEMLLDFTSSIYISSGNKKDNYSVRCLMDESTTASLQIFSPNGAEAWQAGTVQNVTWTSNGVSNVKLEYTTDGGTNWNTIIVSTSASSGSYAWTIPNTNSANCKVRISDASNSGLNDVCDNTFTIYSSNVGGIISSNTTWTLAGSPYIVTNSIIIDSTSTLIIEAGVVVKFNAAKGMKIDGTLIALGTATQNILFTSNMVSPQPGDWTYLFFTNSSKDAITDAGNNYISGSVLQYSQIEYAGASSNRAIYCDNSSPLIKNCLVKSNLGTAIHAINPNNIKIFNSTLRDNIRTGNEYSSNGGGIYISGGNGNIVNNIIYNNQAYQIASGIDIRATVNYTLISGNSVYSNTSNGNDVGVGGIRVSQNTALVEITGNQIYANNGAAGSQGDAGGIKISNNQYEVLIKSNLIERNYPVGISIGQGGFGPTGFARILDNKIYNNQGVGIYFVSSSSDSTQIVGNMIIDNSNCGILGHVAVKKVRIENNIISGNGFNGENKYGIIFLTYDISNTTILNNSIINNDAGGIDQRVFNTGSSNSIMGNTFYGNTGNASIQLLENWNTVSQNNFLDTTTYSLSFSGGSSTSLTCTNNWWGSASTSNISSRIYDFEDDASKGIVNYQPFLNNFNITAPVLPVKSIYKSSVSGGVKITWTPNGETDIAGYKIYYGSPSGYSFANVVDVGNVSNYTINGLSITDTIAVTAYDIHKDGLNDQVDGHESWFSEAVIQQSSISINAPNGSETWQAGSTQNIMWTSTGVTNVKLEYTTNNGIAWSTIIASTIASNVSYSWTIPNTPSTNCKVKVSDVDNSATMDGSDKVFTIFGTDGLLYGGKIYHTVKIGTQTWLKENLDIGTMIQGTANPSNNGTIEKYCYDNSQANCETYGGLYQWNEAMAYSTSPGTKGICPTGWHIPTQTEFQKLITSVNNNSNALKAIGQGTGSGAGTNTSGFSALLAGYRSIYGYNSLMNDANLWSSTESNATVVNYMDMSWSGSLISFNSNTKEYGFSLRCLQDESPTASIQLASPNGSETWQSASTQNITWTSTGVTNVKFDYTTNSGTSWTTIIASTPTSNSSFAWTIPNTPSTQCKVRATDVTNAALFDVSDTTFTISDGNWIVYNTTNSSLPHNSIKSIAVDNAGTKWIGTENGLAKYDGTNWNVYTTSNSNLPYNYVSAIAIDAAGNKWIGTFSRYLAKFDNVNWTVYNTSDWGLPLGAIQAIAIDALGNKWIGTSEGLVKFDGTTGTIYTPSNSGLPYKAVQSIAIDEQGNKWIGTLDSGLVKFDGTNWTVYKTTNSQIPNNQVHAIAVSRYGNKWLGTTGGFAKYDGSYWNVYDRSANYLDNWVFAAAIDNSGNKWTGSMGGVGVYDGANWTSYSTTNSGLPDSRINAIAIDGSENKWFGTNAGGVAVLKAGTTISKTLALLAPNGSESWQANASKNITWSSTNVTNIKLEYTTNSGTTWTTIIGSTSANNGTYAWTIPGVSSANCKVQISDASNSDLTDKSDNVFTIVKVVAPPANLTASAGNKQVTLKWNKNSETDLRIYRVYGGSSANPAAQIDSIKYTDTSKTLFNLTNEVKYYYRITAVDSLGNESLFSNEVNSTPKSIIYKPDQAFEPVTINMATGRLDKAETFTVGTSGKLVRVDLLISRYAGNTADLLFDIRSTSGGFPVTSDANTLVNMRIPYNLISETQGFQTIDFSSQPVNVTAGQVLAIVLRSDPDGESYTWSGTHTINGYPNGHHYFRHPSGWPRPTWYADVAGTDVGFRTYLLDTTMPDVTAPSSPTALTAISKDKAIDLSWKKNLESDVKVYRIYGGTSANPSTKIDSVNYSDTTKTISNLTNGITYYYRITAVDSTGNESGYSNEVSIKPYELVAYFPFNGNTNDESGNGNNVINVSAVAAKDRFGVDGKSYYFDGSQSRMYKDVGEEFRLGNNFTLSVWINVSGNGTDSPRLVAVGPLNTSANYYTMYLDMASRRVGFLLPSPLDPVWSNYVTSTSEGWKLVTATYDGTSVKIYIDNKLDVSKNISYNFPSFSSARLQIGYSENSVPTDKFNGKLDDIRIYNRALTQTEIDSLYYENGFNSITYDGKIYHTVKIGNQTWLKENLDIGEMIPGTANPGNNGTIEKYCYNNDPNNCAAYGGLYQWNEVMAYNTTSGAKGICPTGWHIPTKTEYDTLVSTANGNGNALKAVGQGEGKPGAGTNTSGFSALFAGNRWYSDGQFYNLTFYNYFWNSTGNDATTAYGLTLTCDNNGTTIYSDLKTNGFSVRCIKDESTTASIQIISPNGGESFVAGTVNTITWTSTNVTNVKLEYTTDSGTNWSTIVASTPASNGNYAWLVPTVSSTNCKVLISDVTNSSVTDTSDNVFTINYVNGYDSITYAGKIYHTVKIGAQTWLQENLDIGTMIQGSTNQSDNLTIEKYCYNNDPANCDTYGGLYQWNEAMQYVTTEKAKGICPMGWHIPTKPEFETLKVAVNNDGNAVKAVGQGTGSGAGINTSGFSALLGGIRINSSYFDYLGVYAEFWSSTEYNAPNANTLLLFNNGSNVNLDGYNGGETGFGIRCLKDENPVASIQLISPNGGESLVAGTIDTIKWTSTNVTNVKLEYTTNSGTNWSTIIASTPANNGSYAWTIPNTPSTQCKVKISDVDNSLIADTSDNIFSISSERISYGGKIYHTVKIGTQTWLKENLDIGTMIQGSTNPNNNSTIEKYCYDNNPVNCETYGGLYQWNEAMAYNTAPGSNGICPTGWHIPTNSEFTTLAAFVENNGNALKAIGQGTGAGTGSNTSGFSALLVGYRVNGGIFYHSGLNTYLWSSSEEDINIVHSFYLSHDNSIVDFSGINTSAGVSIRCLKDETPTASLQIISPNGGESFVVGTVDTIKWTGSNVTNVKLEYSTNSGTDWATIIANTSASSGSYAWTIPNTPSTQCKVKISDVDNASVFDTSGIFTITAPVQKITITAPNGGERWKGNSTQQITWNIGSGKSAGSSQKSEVRIQNDEESKIRGKLNIETDVQLTTNNKLLTTNNSIENVRIDYSTNGGSSWTTIANGVTAAPNSYSWVVPKVNSQNCKIRIVDQVDTTIEDTSDAVFEIYSPQIVVTSPNGGEEWYIGTAHNITWTQSNCDTVKISYSTNQGSGWIPIIEMPASAGSYSWTIPETVSLLCKVKICDKADTTFADSSNAYFTIAYAPPVHVVLSSPNGGENWKVGEVNNITWINTNVDTVKIELTTNNGTNWTTIKDSVKASLGTFAWTIPNSPSIQCKIRISDFKNSAIGDSSNAVFTIASIIVKTIAVTAPNGGENWKVGSTQDISWTSNNITKFKIEHTTNNGTNWLQVGYASASPYSWTIPNTTSTQCKVRISDSTDAAVWDSSKSVFTIYKPNITVVYPNGGEELQVGSNINVTWLSSNVQNVSIEYSTTNKKTWSTISASVAASNQSLSWTVPDAVSDSCFIRIKDVSDNTVADTSDAKFRIIPSSPPSLTLTSPVGNEQWKLGTKHFITWTKNKVTTVKIEFSSNDGSSWSTLTSSAVADSGKYEWTVPNTASTVCRIKISDADNALLYSVSPLSFELYYAEIVLTAPNGGEEWMVSETHAITWTSLHVNKVKVELTTDNGANWTVQKDSATASMGNVTWVVPNIPATSTECKIKISDAIDPTVFDVSEQNFTIKGLPKLQVISPKAGDVWEIGTTQAITWYRENIEQIKIELSTNSGSDWMNIASSVQASDQSYNWEVQNYLSQNCLVKISDIANPSFSDTSDVFSIVVKVKPVVLTPNGGEKLTLGQLYDVTWKLGSGKLLAPKVPSHKSGNTKGKFESLETAATSNIRILLSTDDGVSWAEIKNQIAVDSAKFTWTVSGEPSDKCFIKIVDINDASNFDLSDSAFVILDNKIPNILVSTNSLDFENVYQDSTEIKQVNITNTGTADLQILSTSFYQTSSAYKVTTFNQTVKPDSMRSVSISFKPTEIASYADTLYVYHNAVGSPSKIVLTGSGIEAPKPIIKIIATTVTFDTTYIGSNNQKTITIDNEGTADLVISNITADKAVFTPLESSFTLGAGLRHTLTLKFAPTSDSSYSGTLTIQHNAAGSPSQVSLTGQGKKHVPNIVLSSKEINFGVITVYTHTEVTLDINNSGTADLVVSNISSTNNSFATNLTNFVVQPNSSRAVKLTFSPINATQYTGTLTIAHNAGAGVSTVSMAGAGYPVDVIVTRTISFGDITLSGNYRMVGLPGDSSISISKTVSGTQKNDWNAFYDNGVISANQSDYLKEYDGSAKFAFKPGNGFWVVSKNGLTVSANVKPVPLAADSTYSIPLQSNWNIISNPFEKSTSWTKIKQLNSLTTHPLYKWNGQNYDQVSEMTTYEGFYFYNTAGLTSLKIPYDANGTLKKFFKSREVYQLGEKGFSIDCRQEGIEKSSVYAGFNSNSSNDVDDYDYFMPPADFGEVSLVLQNDSLSTDYKKLLVEQRKEIGEGTQFDFTARNNSTQQVQLSVNGIEFFPGSETYLLDKQYNKFTNLKEKNVFTLPHQMGKRGFALLVGSPSFIQERKAKIIPTEYLLYQNFPNPFNPATTIAFGLPKESNVTLTLYNMLGEVVLKNELGSKASGYHEWLLDLSSKTSGVYFYAIQARALDGSKNFREVKKMILIK